MTRKDYVKLAAAFDEAVGDILLDERTQDPDYLQHRLAGWAITLNCVATTLGMENPRFDRSRFYHASGWAKYMRAAR